ncbi:hypothetical protein EKL32_00025 [Flavobacterium sp. GSN2]|nr:hypothetical protein EKL32_00025 [Flavobacterium sp. GSN2]
MLLIIVSFAGTAVAQAPTDVQTLLKLGDNPYTINDYAALDVESTTKGFLPPRMTRLQRNNIVSPVAGLQIWCTDCNGASGLPYIYTGTAWATIASSVATSTLTTGKKSDSNFPTISDWNVVTINGVLVQPSQALPTETGFVWKEIVNDDFTSLPYLDATGTASVPVYKKTSTTTPVTTAGSAFTSGNITLTTLSSWMSPFYFNTYAKTPLGIDYGNPIVLSNWPTAPPNPTVTFENGSSLMPIFDGILTINAGTPLGKVKEYGYICSTNSGASPTTATADTKGVLSTPTSLTNLETYLSSDTFTANYKITLPTTKFFVPAVGTYYFKYYIIVTVANVDRVVYSATPYSWYAAADPVTGGSAVATYVSVGALTPALNLGVPASADCSFPVVFNVKKTGSYLGFQFYNATKSGATTGLSTSNGSSGTFEAPLGNKTINFKVTGTPGTSLLGNTFGSIDRLPAAVIFDTGKMPEAKAVCDGTSPTPIVEVTGPSGRIWMDRNLGATAAAEAFGDIRGFGCLFQWGRGNDGHANVTWGGTGVFTNGTTTTLSPTLTPEHNKFILSSSVPYDWMATKTDFPLNYINNPCPSGFRLPNINEVLNDFGSFASVNSGDGYAMLKLIAGAAGAPNHGLIQDIYGQVTRYSTLDWAGESYVLNIQLSSGAKGSVNQWRGSGIPVRCIKNTGFLPTVYTGKRSDSTNAPVYVSESKVTIKGTLLTLPGSDYDVNIRESGIIWREITNDFTAYPVLPARGLVALPVYKSATSSTVSTVNGSIEVTTPSTYNGIPYVLNANPYYYRAYVISLNGNVGYGDPVIFNVAPPKFTIPTVTPGTTKPTLAGTLTVNAGTAQNVVTEYGYCVSTTNLPTNKVLLSTAATITGLNSSLSAETFTANPVINLPVSSYTVTPNVTNYFRYYVVARGVTTYSDTVSFIPTGL